MNKKLLMICLLVIFFVSIGFAAAENTCERNSGDGCTITITMKIAFSGTDNATIEDWVDDITDTWNGYTYGDCKCDVKVEVEWKNTGNRSCQSNYSSTEAGYHCINVSNTTHVSAAGNNYRGFMWGISKNGSSIAGFWGTSINSNLPGVAGTIHDAAHEAGHMLGLEDEYNASTNTYPPNIMGRTWGNNSKPTQGHIDSIVEKNCEGDDAECPDECCCGDGEVQADKGEECEEDDDCEEGANPLCLSCKCYYIDVCGDGEITGEEECDPGASPSGCNETEFCNPATCVCEEIELSITITEPDDEDEFDLGDTITVEIDIDSGLDITEVEYSIDDELEETLEEEPWEWEFLAADYGPGEHEIKVKVTDEDDNTDSDKVDIIIA